MTLTTSLSGVIFIRGSVLANVYKRTKFEACILYGCRVIWR